MRTLAVRKSLLAWTILMMLAFMFLWRLRRHGHGLGWRYGVYLVLAGAERFIIEFVRAKDDRIFGPLSVAQLTSTLVALADRHGMVYQSDALHAGWNGALIGPEESADVIYEHLYRRAATIYGGSSEVQKNIIAKGALGL